MDQKSSSNNAKKPRRKKQSSGNQASSTAASSPSEIPATQLSKSAKRRNAKKRRQVAALQHKQNAQARPTPSVLQGATPLPRKSETKEPKPTTVKAGDSNTRQCMVCGDAINADGLFYDCSRSPEHTQCVSCFADYVRHCCDHYWTGKFPLRCPIPSCRARVDDVTLRYLLAAAPAEPVTISSQPTNNSLWSLYERATLDAALADISLSNEEVVVTCTACSKYAEIFPKDYHVRANKLVSAFRLWKLEQDFKKKEKQREKEQEEKKRKAEEEKLRAAAPPPANARRGSAPSSAVAIDLSSLEVPPPEALSRAISVERFKPAAEIGMTSHFFTCRTPDCGASICLRCSAFVPKSEELGHTCELDRLHELFLQVLDVLAESSTQRCPQCKRVGRKDLNCCHITCDSPCGVRWCYVCASVPPASDFGTHNQWSVESAPGQHCPMYLHYKYGDVFTAHNGLFNGDSQLCLNRFHVELQRKAVAKLKEETKDDQLWDEMMKAKFPSGIWNKEDIQFFEERERKWPEYVDARKKWKVEEEEKRRIAEEAARRQQEERERLRLEQQRAAEERLRQQREERERRQAERIRQREEFARVRREARSAMAATLEDEKMEVGGLFDDVVT